MVLNADQDKLAYLARAFDRAREEAMLSAGKARLRVMAEAAKAGAFQSGRSLLSVKDESGATLKRSYRAMVLNADQDKLAYLARAFDRAREEAMLSAGKARLRVMAEAAKAGAFQSGRMLLNVKDESGSTLKRSYRAMVLNADQDKLAYLARAFDRAREEAMLSAGKARLRGMAEAAKAGAFQSGRMLLKVKDESGSKLK